MYEALLQIALVYGLGCFGAGSFFTLLILQLYRLWQRRNLAAHDADTGKVVAFPGRRTDNLV